MPKKTAKTQYVFPEPVKLDAEWSSIRLKGYELKLAKLPGGAINIATSSLTEAIHAADGDFNNFECATCEPILRTQAKLGRTYVRVCDVVAATIYLLWKVRNGNKSAELLLTTLMYELLQPRFKDAF